MVKEQRYNTILSELETREHLSVDEAIELLGVSRSTVCRYFNDLAERQVAVRSHGGISVVKNNNYRQLPYELRHSQNLHEKQLLAKEAVKLINDRDTIFLDGGTTTLQMASMLPAISTTVVTNSLHHASTIIEKQMSTVPIEVFIAGGYVYAPWHVNIGPQTQYCLQQYHANVAFMSAKGMDASGTYNHNEMIVESERTMIANADKVVFVADGSKIGEKSAFFLCDFKQIDILITSENQRNEKILEEIREQGVKVITVDKTFD